MLTRVAAILSVVTSISASLVAQTTPSITSLGRNPLAIGGRQYVQGIGFGASQGGSSLLLNGTSVQVSNWSDTDIEFTVPTGTALGTATVQVTTLVGASSPANFTVVATPVVSGISPTSGPGGTQISISGSNFGAAQGQDSSVQMVGSLQVVSWSDSQVVVRTPSNLAANTYQVQLIANGAAAANTPTFTVTGSGAPQLVSLAVTPANLALAANNSQQFTATGTLSDGTTADYTAAATWNSSNTSVVSISSANGSQGLAVMKAAGTANITATVGSISGTTGITVQTPATPNITGVSPSSGAPGTQVTITGSGFGAAQRGGSVLLGTINGTVVSWNDTTVVASVALGAKSGTVQVLQNGLTSNAVNFSVTLPQVASISPTSGSAGTPVTINGSGFGTTQGNGKVWLGSTFGTVVTWSDTQITATVAPNASSGTAQVMQGAGAWSNSVSFSVSGAMITSVTPTSGLSGTQVAIAGSGFGSSQGKGQVWLGTAPAVVTSWSDGQIQATVAQGSTTGVAQVLQNGVLSNAITFTVNLPQISSVSPSSGTAGTSVTISGSGFGSSQGSGVVWIGNAPGNVVTWNDTQVQATVASNAISGIVKVEQNGVWSNAVSFVVPQSTGTPVSLSPALISMVIGETRSLQALDSTGKPVGGLTWASSDTNLATLSTDDPPVITAIAPGHVTISAGNASTDLTIYAGALPLGAFKWWVPDDGSGIRNFFAAAPRRLGADVFAQMADGNIEAIRTDGSASWTTNIGTPGPGLTLIPDFQGGLTYTNFDAFGLTVDTIKRLDGLTGQPSNLYTYQNRADFSGRRARVFPDGTVLTVDGDTVVGIDPQTASVKFSIQLEHSIISGPTGHCIGDNKLFSDGFAGFGDFIIAGDGYAYVVYFQTAFTVVPFPPVFDYEVGHKEQWTKILRVGPSGDFSKITVNDWTWDWIQTFVCPSGGGGSGFHPTEKGGQASPGFLITNADQGVLLPLQLDSGNYVASNLTFIPPSTTFQLAFVSSGGSVSQVPMSIPDQSGPVFASVQSANGTFFGAAANHQGQGFLIAFDQSGNLNWSVPGSYNPVMAIDDGGLIAQSLSLAVTVTAFDQSGNAVAQLNSSPSLSWTGNSYGKEDGLSQVVSQEGVAVDAASFWPQTGGNPSGNMTSAIQYFGLLQTTDDSVLPAPTGSASASVCPICALQSPQCTPTIGTGSKFLLIVGDPGLRDHNLHDLLNLAAQQKANDLSAQGHSVVACRASSINDFHAALLNHGFIDGGVIYFGHGGEFARHDPFTGRVSTYTILAVGETSAQGTNIGTGNVSMLSDLRTQLCSDPNNIACNIIGPNAAILINGCDAGKDVYDSLAQKETSIAQELALQISRGVYAYEVGVYFSHQDKDHETHFDGTDVVNGQRVPRTVSWGLPMYAVPTGTPGSKPDPTPFPRKKTNLPPAP